MRQSLLKPESAHKRPPQAEKLKRCLPQQEPVSDFRRVLQICVGTADAAPLGTPRKLETLEGLNKRAADTFARKRSSNKPLKS